MGTILIVENDPIFGAVLEDRLHVAGHQVELLGDGERAAAALAASPADLLIYATKPSDDDQLDLIRGLRKQAETRALPILVLSESTDPSDRLEALRAGADEVLAKPCDFDELMIRTERLAGGGIAQEPVLDGNLTSHPPWELMQYLRQAAKSGDLVLRSSSVGGRIRVREGRITAARCAHLPGPEALLALIGLKEGRFRFVSETEGPEVDPSQELSSIHEVLLQAAWLEDELEKRSDHLPVSGAPLSVTGKALPQVKEALAALPLADVHQLLSVEPGRRVHDLIGRLPVAPQKIRLAVAWLIENGVLATPEGRGKESFPTTTEITASMLMDIAVSDFLKAARAAGFSSSVLPFLILAEPGVWPALLDLIENVPGYQGNDGLKTFSEQLRLRRGGSVTFESDLGKLSLHAQVLKKEVRPQIEAVVTACTGVLLWLDEGGDEDLVRSVIERLEKVRDAAAGMMVATRQPARELADQLLAGAGRWRVSTHAPQSLLGVLRLLQPSRET